MDIYEDESGWNDLTAAGIPSSAVDGEHLMEITVPVDQALPVQEYLITGRMYEIRERG